MWLRRTGRQLLRPHELAVVDAVLGALPDQAADLVEQQLRARTKVSRIIDDSDVMLYPAPQRQVDEERSLPNRSPDLRLATVRLAGPRGKGKATVTATLGWVFMIEFRPPPKRLGRVTEIAVEGVTVHEDPMQPDAGPWSRLAGLDPQVRASIERALSGDLDECVHIAAPSDMYSVTLDDGVFMVLAQLPDTDFIAARVDPPGPGVRRYDTDGELVGEYASLRDACS